MKRTPRSAIRQKCLECIGNENVRNEVRYCTASTETCWIWPYRGGRKWDAAADKLGYAKTGRLACIKLECLLCMGWKPDRRKGVFRKLVKECESVNCPFHHLRIGRLQLSDDRRQQMADSARDRLKPHFYRGEVDSESTNAPSIDQVFDGGR